MSPVSDPKFRFSDVVYAIETTPKSLRQWFQNGQASGVNESERQGWLSFDFLSLALLAVMRKCVDFGVPVDAAKCISFEQLFAYDHLPERKSLTASMLSEAWDGRVLIVWREGETYRQRICSEDFSQTPPSDSYFVIHMEELLRKVFARAAESVIRGTES